jgi:hypothetical protein
MEVNVQSHNPEQQVGERYYKASRVGEREWPVLAGLGVAIALLLMLGYTAVSGAGRDASAGAVEMSRGAQVLPAGIAIACAPGQQALLKQVDTAGQPIVQVECVPVAGLAGSASLTSGYAPGVMGVGSMASPMGARAVPAVFTPSGDDVVYRRPARRTVVERRSGRSWQKSAVIIGSSAGIGAGVGAAVGGKKGALIGAAVGGGGAAIWDQITRRR